jgi:hypothetical protein
LDSQDGMKLDAGTPKPPMQPPGAPKPPSPGVPPGGLDASKAMKPKEEGDLIE